MTSPDLLSRSISDTRPAEVVVSRNRAFVGVLRMLSHKDFSVVVKNRADPPKQWRWEIYRAGRRSPIALSDDFFTTVTEASRAGDKALGVMLSECPLSDEMF